MQQFATAREAKEYLIGRILAQADQEGVSLTDIERKMLYFSESGWTLPDMMTIGSEFDQQYNQNEYEKKIAKVVQHICDGNADSAAWSNAVLRLREEDHYLLVLIDAASRFPAGRPPRDVLRLIVAAGMVVVVLFLVMSFVNSHIADKQLARLANGVAFFGALACAMLLNRR
jgi:hypothetical protein